MKRYTIIVSPRAAKEIDEAAMWWTERGLPTLVDDALATVLDRLQAFISPSPPAPRSTAARPRACRRAAC